jgi:hypothetical protein
MWVRYSILFNPASHEYMTALLWALILMSPIHHIIVAARFANLGRSFQRRHARVLCLNITLRKQEGAFRRRCCRSHHIRWGPDSSVLLLLVSSRMPAPSDSYWRLSGRELNLLALVQAGGLIGGRVRLFKASTLHDHLPSILSTQHSTVQALPLHLVKDLDPVGTPPCGRKQHRPQGSALGLSQCHASLQVSILEGAQGKINCGGDGVSASTTTI